MNSDLVNAFEDDIETENSRKPIIQVHGIHNDFLNVSVTNFFNQHVSNIKFFDIYVVNISNIKEDDKEDSNIKRFFKIITYLREAYKRLSLFKEGIIIFNLENTKPIIIYLYNYDYKKELFINPIEEYYKKELSNESLSLITKQYKLSSIKSIISDIIKRIREQRKDD